MHAQKELVSMVMMTMTNALDLQCLNGGDM